MPWYSLADLGSGGGSDDDAQQSNPATVQFKRKQDAEISPLEKFLREMAMRRRDAGASRPPVMLSDLSITDRIAQGAGPLDDPMETMRRMGYGGGY